MNQRLSQRLISPEMLSCEMAVAMASAANVTTREAR
jgi:hypothetical protein